MIRIGLYSDDPKLQQILSSVLGKEFQVFLETTEEGIDCMVADGGCDVVILDLDSNHVLLQDRIACCRRIVRSRVSSVVMADDTLRATAAELVRLGAYSYCRQPPSIRDLKALLHRVYEGFLIRLKLSGSHQLQEVDAATSCVQL